MRTRNQRSSPDRWQIAALLTALLALTSNGAAETSVYDPVADPRAVVTCGHARFTMLTPTLVRLEWSPDGRFEDRASYFAVNRKLPIPEFRAEGDGARVAIVAPNFEIDYAEDDSPFSEKNLKVRFRVRSKWIGWTTGAEAPGNLLGTMRTLDGVSGSTGLERGVLTRSGWTFLDDSRSILFDNSDWPWAIPRTFQTQTSSADEQPAAAASRPAAAVASDSAPIDWYLFVYGDDYPAALRDFIAVGGKIPLPPRWAFGAWWSRYWEYSEEELRTLVGEFREHGVPLDVLVVDMDWHLDGWTGYTWNPEVFPDPEGFLRWCHEQGLKVPLNLHPADGVHPHERAFADVCRELGFAPNPLMPVPFDCTSKEYMCAYFKHLHHPLQREGIDFWWIDWQQGKDTRLFGLDPLPWLNYLHWDDLLRNPMLVGKQARGHAGTEARRESSDDGENQLAEWPYGPDQVRRPLLFSRWGGLGNHRYQIGFSGDTFCDWESLAFQPYFTATAGNVGYAYWSHDIGGHQPGPVDPELYTRWIQWGAFSPILRTHTTKNPLAERRIWEFPPPYYAAMKKAWLLRYELIPYIYTMARKCYDTGLPLCRPLYYEWPNHEEAYTYRNVYMFGDDLLVAPITTPAAPETGLATAKVWLPPGEWVHWFTGQRWKGPRELRLPTPLDQIPLFVRAGAVIPAAVVNTGDSRSEHDARVSDSLANARMARLHVFPNAHGESSFYEDDGISRAYEAQDGSWFDLDQSIDGSALIVRARPKSDEGGGPRERQYQLLVHDIGPPTAIEIDRKLIAHADNISQWRYDHSECAVYVNMSKRQGSSVEFKVRKTDNESFSYSVLRSGERGRIQTLTQWSALLGDAVPQKLIEAIKGVREIIVRPENKVARSIALSALSDAATELGKLDPDPVRRNHILSKMLGLTADFEFEAGTESSLRLIAGMTDEFAQAPIHVILRSGDKSITKRLTSKELVEIPIPNDWSATSHEGVPQTIGLSATVRIEGEPDQALDIELKRHLLPSINAWWLAGPFEQSAAKDMDARFSALTEIDFAATWPGKSSEIAKWHRAVRKVTPDSDLRREFFVAFRESFGFRPDNACAYAVAFIDSEAAQLARLALGSDDGNTTWLNGKEVFSIRTGRAYQPRQQTADVDLRAGRNVLVLRVDQQGGDWGFSVFLEDRAGKPLQNVKVVCPQSAP